MFQNKNILIGITGGIACYKVCEIITYLVEKLAKKETIIEFIKKNLKGDK